MPGVLYPQMNAAGFETFAHVAQACHRILEELRAKTREAKIVDRLER